MPYMKVKFFVAVILILIVGGKVLTSLPRVSAQREDPLSADEQKLLEVAANREGLNSNQLQLLNSSTAFQYSVRWDNSYEVVDFVATTSGPFQIKVKNFRFDGFNGYLAVAWSLS